MKISKEAEKKFENVKLTKYERELSASIARGEWVSVLTDERRKELQEMAREHIEARKSETITFRITPEDLDEFKAKAYEQNIPYQTLLGSVIRKYNRGILVEK